MSTYKYKLHNIHQLLWSFQSQTDAVCIFISVLVNRTRWHCGSLMLVQYRRRSNVGGGVLCCVFRPLLWTYRINWARRTTWGWWDKWDHTSLQTRDSKFKPWRSEAEHASSRSRRLLTILFLRVLLVDGEETFLFPSNRRNWETNPEI